MTELADADLVARCRDRDTDAFGMLVERHQRLVFGVALARCKDRALAEDVAQDAFVAAWRDLGRLRDGHRVGSWMAGIARNLAASATRTRERRGEPAIEPATVPTPEDAALEREDRELLARALDDVPETHREVLVLFYLQGESIAAIAAALEISEDTVKQRLSRGRRALREGVVARVERALVRVRRPALKAGVLAALATTAGTREAAAATGKAIAVMSTKKLAVAAVAMIAVAGGTAWFVKSRADADVRTPESTEPAANAAGTTRGTASERDNAPAPTAGTRVRKIDPAARKTMLEAIRKRNAARGTTAATAGSSPSASPAPALPADDKEMKQYIRASVRELIPLLAECYQAGLDKDPKLAGKVVVEFTIEGDPDVGGVVGDSKVDPEESTLADAAVHECMQETMHALEIDPPSGGGVVNVRYPFEFRPAEE